MQLRLFLALAALGAVSSLDHDHHHECIHDKIIAGVKPVTAHQTYHNHPWEKAMSPASPQSHHFSPLAQMQTLTYDESSFQPIRLFFDVAALSSDVGYMCKTAGAQYTDNSNGGQTSRTCSKDDVASADKLAHLQNIILPAAQAFYTQALRVHRVKGSLKISTGWNNNMECMHTKINKAHTETGVGNYDYLLYITARPTQGSTLAWAGACQFDQYDRPIAGQANFGPNQIQVSNDPAVIAQQVSTAIHEIAHALGFSSGSFERFRDPQGNTRTKVVQQFTERGKTVSKLTTPNLIAKARQHFGCSTLNGVEIEDSGGSGTAGSHLEKRIYMNEFMTGTTSSDPVYSAIGLALFEDSGWYQVNYAAAGNLAWGKNHGCAFATGSCSSWPQAAQDAGMFCSTESKKYCAGSVMQYKGYCNLVSYTSSLPSSHQYFSDPVKGGNDQLADFCPYVSAYSNGDCRSVVNKPPNDYFGESYASDSRCFIHKLLKKGYQYDGETTTGCFKTRCDVSGSDVILYVTVNGKEKACPKAGGIISFTDMQGDMTCPPAATMCVHTTSSTASCPNDCNGRGSCAAGVCNCDPPFTGSSCSEQPVSPTLPPTAVSGPAPTSPPADFCASGANKCSGHGSCSGGKCVCTVGWSGSDCSVADSTPLRAGIAVTATVQKGQSVYYYSAAPISPLEEVTVTVTATSGDPDVYVSFKDSKPGEGKSIASAATDKSPEIVNIDANTAQRNTVSSTLYIAVTGYSASAFSITLATKSKTCSAATTCSGHGTCTSSGGCTCATGWSGSDCNAPDCPGTPDCNSRGACVTTTTPPSCKCNAGSSGASCETVDPSSSTQAIPQTGGSRAISALAANAWKYFFVTLTAPLPGKLVVTFALPPCVDSTTFKDAAFKDPCSGWEGYKCEAQLPSFTEAMAADLRKNCPRACKQCAGQGTMLFARFGTQPSMTGTSYTSDFFDEASFQGKSEKHTITIGMEGRRPGTLWIGIFNHGTYANGPVTGTLAVASTTVARLESTCSRSTTCSGNGDCFGGECQCDVLFHGTNCNQKLTKLSEGVSAAGKVEGRAYKFYYFEVTTEDAFSVTLDVTPVGLDSEKDAQAQGEAGQVRPRLFVRKAPDLPVANQLAFTDFPSAQKNGKTLSVFVDSSDLGSGIWYIGVLNAVDSVPMDFTISVKAYGQESVSTPKCSVFQSQNCLHENPTFSCESGVIDDIKFYDIWYDPKRPDRVVDPSTCDDPASDRYKYKYCHTKSCSEVSSCLGKTSCTLEEITIPDYFYDACVPDQDNPNITITCGMKLQYICKAPKDTKDVCPETGSVCGPKGTCANSDGRPVCQCMENWLGSDCKTPPPFSARLADTAAAVLTEEQAFPIGSTEDTSASADPGAGTTGGTSPTDAPAPTKEKPMLSASHVTGPAASVLFAAALASLFY